MKKFLVTRNLYPKQSPDETERAASLPLAYFALPSIWGEKKKKEASKWEQHVGGGCS